jgi:murein DD-endopeptidase MepM/ murein hydrolase activator NlpD
LGEDWNGKGGGDTDLGAPVYSIAHGFVVFAKDYRAGWGNVIIIRHAYQENGRTEYADSLYGHLHEMLVKEGQQITRGEKIGTIGNNRGMYDAHLHFELRRNIQIGMHRHRFPRDFTSYWDPTSFITARPALPGGGKIVSVPVNTFNTAPTTVAESSAADDSSVNATVPSSVQVPKPPVIRRTPFKVDRFQDLRSYE